ncbi:tetratricopeptide repeat protein [Marinilabilia sp.]|uniref:tetratricopeptide repeat protein n=1 Tax=Marinilabilia sp. TaxID=2021252 RepID=UPI0025BBFED7|nr:tetratricopeptide repeat protein [Marinilabilia sp.]
MKALFLTLILSFLSLFCYSQEDRSLIYNNDGVVQMNKRDFSSAIESFSKAIMEDSLNSLFYRNRAYCYFYDGQYEKSEKDFLQCIALGDEKPEFFYYLGLGRYNNNDIRNALDYYGRAIELDPQNSDYYYRRGIAFLKDESFEDAVSDFHLSIKLNPQHAASYFHRGQSYHMLRNNRAACADWTVAEKLDPELTAEQFEKVCSGNDNTEWHDLKEVTELETVKKPVFDKIDFEEFKKYVTKEISFPPQLLRSESIVYSSHRLSILADGSVGNIEKLHSGSALLDKAFKKTVLEGEDLWEGGNINGIPADFKFVGPIGFFTSEYKEESERLKKLIDEEIVRRDDATALKHCNKVLELHPYEIDMLRMRIVLNSRLGNDVQVSTDKELLNELTQIKFRYKPEEIVGVKAEMLILPEDSVTIFYNEDWHITNQDKAVYFRKGIWSKSKNFFIGTVSDYMLVDSVLISRINYVPGVKKEGEYLARYPDGNKQAEGKFVNNKMDGRWNFFAQDGTLRYVVNFDDKYFKFRVLNDDQGNDILNLPKESFELKLSRYISLKGAFENGQRDKTWVLEANDKKLIREVYKEGEFVRGLYFENGERIPLPSSGLNPVIFTPTNIAVTERLIFDSKETFDAYPFINSRVVQ